MEWVTKCSNCNKIILGRYYKDWSDQKLCMSCYDHVNLCVSCGRFCVPVNSANNYPDPLCHDCISNRITPERVPALIGSIKQLYSHIGLPIVTRCNLKLVDMNRIFSLSHNHTTRGVSESSGKDYNIYIYNCLSRVVFAEVAAHELLHIYQYENNINPPAEICEGFCNLGSYIVLNNINSPENTENVNARINNLLTESDPIYGDGFRYMLSIYENYGLQGVMNEINKYKR